MVNRWLAARELAGGGSTVLRRCCRTGSGRTTHGSATSWRTGMGDVSRPAPRGRSWLTSNKGATSWWSMRRRWGSWWCRFYPDADPHAQDQYAAEAFARWLRYRRVAFLVFQEAPITLAEATAFAETCEHNYWATMRKDKPRAGSRRVSWADEETDSWSSEEETGRVCRTATPPPASTPSWAAGSSATAPHSRSPGSEDGLTQVEQRLAKLKSLWQQALTGSIPSTVTAPQALPPSGEPATSPKAPAIDVVKKDTSSGSVSAPKPWEAERWQVRKRVGVRHNGPSQTPSLQQGQPLGRNATQPTTHESNLLPSASVAANGATPSPAPPHHREVPWSQPSEEAGTPTPNWELALPPLYGGPPALEIWAYARPQRHHVA